LNKENITDSEFIAKLWTSQWSDQPLDSSVDLNHNWTNIL